MFTACAIKTWKLGLPALSVVLGLSLLATTQSGVAGTIASVADRPGPSIIQGPPRYGGTFITANTEDPANLNPLLGVHFTNNWIISQLFDTLVSYDWDLNMYGRLAHRWELSDDRLTWTFHLRENVKWHDGMPFTSADVKWTFDQYLLHSLPRSGAWKGSVKSIETPDPHTVVFNLEQPNATFVPVNLAAWRGVGILPKHLYEGTDILENPHNWDPIGTGPFKLKEWARGDQLTFERFDDYWEEGKPYLDEWIVKIMPSSPAQLVALESGEIHGLPSGPGLTPTDAKLMDGKPGVFVDWTAYRGLGNRVLLFDMVGNEHLQHHQVREALGHAIDRDELNDIVFEGLGIARASSFLSPRAPWYASDLPEWVHDPAKAESLLEEAGFARGSGGERFSLRFAFQAASANERQIAEVVKSQFATIGVNVVLDPLDTANLVEKVLTNYDFDMFLAFNGFGSDATWLEAYYYGPSAKPGSYNVARYDNPEFNELFEKQRGEADPAKRLRMWHELQRIWRNDLPGVPVINTPDLIFAFSDEFVGVDHESAGRWGWQVPVMHGVWWKGGELPSR